MASNPLIGELRWTHDVMFWNIDSTLDHIINYLLPCIFLALLTRFRESHLPNFKKKYTLRGHPLLHQRVGCHCRPPRCQVLWNRGAWTSRYNRTNQFCSPTGYCPCLSPIPWSRYQRFACPWEAGCCRCCSRPCENRSTSISRSNDREDQKRAKRG